MFAQGRVAEVGVLKFLEGLLVLRMSLRHFAQRLGQLARQQGLYRFFGLFLFFELWFFRGLSRGFRRLRLLRGLRSLQRLDRPCVRSDVGEDTAETGGAFKSSHVTGLPSSSAAAGASPAVRPCRCA